MRRLAGLSLLLAVVCAAPACGAGEAGSRFVAVGHLFGFHRLPLARLPEGRVLLELLASRINREAPDYVFVLGDLTRGGEPRQWRWMREHFVDHLEGEVYFTPGNHDLRAGESAYRREVGYLDRRVRAPHANFLIANSNTPGWQMLRNLAPLLEAIRDEGRGVPTLLLTHHFVWWRPPPRGPHQRAARYGEDPIVERLRGSVDAVIAGDGSRLFGRWIVGGLPVYAAGMGLPAPPDFDPIFFASGIVRADGSVAIRAVPVAVPADHPWARPGRADAAR